MSWLVSWVSLSGRAALFQALIVRMVSMMVFRLLMVSAVARSGILDTRRNIGHLVSSTSRYASPSPSPLSSYEVIANRLCAAPFAAVPHCSTTARVFLVEPKTSGPQTCPAFFRQGVGKNRVMPKRPRCFPRSPVEHRASVPCSIGAKARYLCRRSVVKSWRYRPANNRHAAQCSGFILNAYRKLVANNRAAVPVQSAHKLIRGLQVSWHNSQFHRWSKARHNITVEATCRIKPRQSPHLQR